jgi:hypothetical protein
LEQVTLDQSGNPYVVGSTWSNDFPTAGTVYQPALHGFQNAFIAKYPNTQPGTNIAVAPSSVTSVTFGTLTSSGQTTVTTSATGPTPPAGFSFGNTFYNFTSTAIFSGNLSVCIDYVPSNYTNPSMLKLFHFQSGAWVDVTSTNDTTTGVICGSVTSLSPFAIGAQFEPLNKNNCKEGQWQLWTSPKFKNQGQCTKFVNQN